MGIICAPNGYLTYTTWVAYVYQMGIACTPHGYRMHTTWGDYLIIILLPWIQKEKQKFQLMASAIKISTLLSQQFFLTVTKSDGRMGCLAMSVIEFAAYNLSHGSWCCIQGHAVHAQSLVYFGGFFFSENFRENQNGLIKLVTQAWEHKRRMRSMYYNVFMKKCTWNTCGTVGSSDYFIR